MINCHDFAFSKKLSQQRLIQFEKILGKDFINRILCFTFFLLGVDRKMLSKSFKIPPGTVRSLIRSIRINGIVGFNDRRRKETLLPKFKKTESFQIAAFMEDKNIVINLGSPEASIKVPEKNTEQIKLILLTLLNNKLISNKEVSQILKLSPAHISNISNKLYEKDASCLIDKREGQRHDYKFTPEIKAEIIQEFAAHVISKRPASGRVLSEDIKARCNLELSSRSIRHHMQKLGLLTIKDTLPVLVDSLKKTSK